MPSEQKGSRIVTILLSSAIAAIFIVAIVYDVPLGIDTIVDLIEKIPQNPQSEGGILAALFASLSALGYLLDRLFGQL